MSILIKGMDMPRNCGERLCIDIHPDGKVSYNLDLKCKQIATAVFVPPHGRLIDADALEGVLILTLESIKENPKMNKEEMHLIAAFHTLGVMIDDAPTIIEAEE